MTREEMLVSIISVVVALIGRELLTPAWKFITSQAESKNKLLESEHHTNGARVDKVLNEYLTKDNEIAAQAREIGRLTEGRDRLAGINADLRAIIDQQREIIGEQLVGLKKRDELIEMLQKEARLLRGDYEDEHESA